MYEKIKIDWKNKFEKFIAEVSFEKRKTPRLTWCKKHERVVCKHFGIGCDQISIKEIGEELSFNDAYVCRLLVQAKKILDDYYTNQNKMQARASRLAQLAEDIKRSGILA